MMKLIGMDADVTLIDDVTRSPSAKTIEVLKRCHDNGILLAIASGRNVEQVQTMVKEYNFGYDLDLIIGFNGAEIYDGFLDKKIQYCTLDKETIKHILTNMLGKYPDLIPQVYNNDYLITVRESNETYKNHNSY